MSNSLKPDQGIRFIIIGSVRKGSADDISRQRVEAVMDSQENQIKIYVRLT